MSHEPAPGLAYDDLARAADVTARLRSQTRWRAAYLAMFPLLFVGMSVADITLGNSDALFIALLPTAFFLAAFSGIQRFGRRQRVLPRHSAWRDWAYWITAWALGITAFILGGPHRERPAYLLLIGLIMSLPYLFGAWREYRA
jgi:hypothetical protein